MSEARDLATAEQAPGAVSAAARALLTVDLAGIKANWRWLAAVDTAADDLAELWQLRHAMPFPWAAEVAAIRSAGTPLRRGDLAITGQDLMAAGIPAGPAVGQVLERLLALVVDEPTLNVREALLERAKELA